MLQFRVMLGRLSTRMNTAALNIVLIIGKDLTGFCEIVEVVL